MSLALRSGYHTPIRPRSSPEVIKDLTRRLTQRDRWLMRLVWRHRVLTTDQLAALGFGSYNTAKQRLATLHQLRALDRIRPWRPHAGSPPWHYVLDQPGAEILAAEDNRTLRDMGYRRDRALAMVNSSTLGHTLGTNQVFIDLHTTAWTRLQWWTESECAELWGDIVRPDGAGRFSTDNRSVDFFLEYDTGTERLRRLSDKLDAYAELAQLSPGGIVLLYLPTHRREAHIRQLLGSHPPVVVATATHDAHPSEAVWVRADDPHLRPQHLTNLTPEHPHQPSLFESRESPHA